MLRNLLILSLLLTSCAPRIGDRIQTDLEQNPLYAEVLADERIDFLTGMLVSGITDPDVRRAHERSLASAQRLQRWSHKQQDEGEDGLFMSDFYFLEGMALLLGDALHLSYDFEVEAAPDLHVALSMVLIPRTYDDFQGGVFLDLGPLQVTRGPQTYQLSTPVQKDTYASVVIYSPSLKVVLGFAQI